LFDFIDVVSPVYPQDVSEKTRDLVTLETLFKNTSKHVNIRVLNEKNLSALVTMGEIVAGGTDELKKNPVFSLFDSPRSPLVFPELTVDVFMTAGKYGIPLFVASMPVAGASGPVTLDGMVQLLHTELLASVVICQTANPGAPILLHPLAMSLDWRKMSGLTSSIEVIKITMGIIQVANKIFNVPIDAHGPWSDTSTFGLQSSIESVFQTIFPAFCGAASIAGAGDVREGKAVSHIQLCIDEEIAGLVINYLEGIPFHDDFSVGAIKRVGIGGNFLKDYPSLEFASEQLKRGKYYYEPKILKGEPDVEVRVRERIKKLTTEHKPASLDAKVKKELRKLIKSAE